MMLSVDTNKPHKEDIGPIREDDIVCKTTLKDFTFIHDAHQNTVQ